MTIKITNQRPAEVYQPHNILPKIDVSLSEQEYIEKQQEFLKERLVEPLFTPLNAQNNVVMQDASDPANPIDFDQDAVTSGIWHLWTSDTVDPNLDRQLTDIYYQSLLHSQANDWTIEEQQGLEVISKLNQPIPSSGQNGRVVAYTPNTDIIPVAKQLLANPSNTNLSEQWFAGLTGFIHNRMTNMTLITVQSSFVWDQIKMNVQNIRNTFNQQGLIKQNTNQLLSDFDKISLDGKLSSGIFLPRDNSDEQYSFTRILMNLLAIYEENHPDETFVQPINSMEYIIPRNVIILNLEEYAHATDKEIIDDWNDLEKAFTIQNKLNMVSTKKLMTAEAVNSATSPSSNYSRNPKDHVIRRTQQPFSDKPITSKKMLELMAKVIKRTTTNKQTENTFKGTKRSYMRPNRRDPNNINLMGKLSTINYHPDIHVYIDTSGSISESQYRDAVGGLIQLTKKIDANLYVSSFSHIISQTTLLKTKNKSTKQIYQEFLKIPKVAGGTEFENVWNKIDQLDKLNQKAGKSYQLNFVITDFGYGLRRDRRFHREQPSHKYTYYVPISTNPREWSYIKGMAKSFSAQMAASGAKGIRNHMLM